jgi:hypothetical protein
MLFILILGYKPQKAAVVCADNIILAYFSRKSGCTFTIFAHTEKVIVGVYRVQSVIFSGFAFIVVVIAVAIVIAVVIAVAIAVAIAVVIAVAIAIAVVIAVAVIALGFIILGFVAFRYSQVIIRSAPGI